MKINTFRKRIKKLVFEDGWQIYLDGKNKIRLHKPNGKQTFCPLTALYKEKTGEFVPVMKAGHLPPEEYISAIVAVSDDSLAKLKYVLQYAINDKCGNYKIHFSAPLSDATIERYKTFINLRKWMLKTFNLVEK